MNLTYAVDRLYQSGWTPAGDEEGGELELLPDGRRFPSIRAVQREFARAGLQLSIKHTPQFSCYRSIWSPSGEMPGGTVIGACEREAAVYALAQLREARAEQLLETV